MLATPRQGQQRVARAASIVSIAVPAGRSGAGFASGSPGGPVGTAMGRLTRISLASALVLTAPMARAQSVDWPLAGPDRGYLNLKGFVDTLADFVGPIDGSAKLTVFAEGNHYPVLLPLLLDAFPAWCRSTGSCDVAAADILIVTLPQTMVVEMLLKGGIRLGSATVPIHKPGVFPDFVMGGSGSLQRLAAAGIIERRATVFARHRGLGLLLAKRLADIADLEGFASGIGRVVLASDSEPTARNQYVATLGKLIGAEATSRLLAREVGVFPGRLGIQHRDVPYAVLNDLADGGIIFAHLAQFYTLSFPDALRAVSVPAAADFGRDIALARVAGERPPTADAFARFFLAAARSAYPDGGFSPLSDFAYGRVIDLTAR
jgi:hypothetical protein